MAKKIKRKNRKLAKSALAKELDRIWKDCGCLNPLKRAKFKQINGNVYYAS